MRSDDIVVDREWSAIRADHCIWLALLKALDQAQSVLIYAGSPTRAKANPGIAVLDRFFKSRIVADLSKIVAANLRALNISEFSDRIVSWWSRSPLLVFLVVIFHFALTLRISIAVIVVGGRLYTELLPRCSVLSSLLISQALFRTLSFIRFDGRVGLAHLPSAQLGPLSRALSLALFQICSTSLALLLLRSLRFVFRPGCEEATKCDILIMALELLRPVCKDGFAAYFWQAFNFCLVFCAEIEPLIWENRTIITGWGRLGVRL